MKIYKILLPVFFIILIPLVSLFFLELFLRLQSKPYVLEEKAAYEKKETEKISPLDYDPELGWIQKPNLKISRYSEEFKSHYVYTNSFGMSDDEFNLKDDEKKIRILVLGDSHTQGTGVSTEDSWPNVLENLFKLNKFDKVVVYNAGVGAYNVDQYLISFRRFKDKLKPHIVIIGFSVATDFYDVGRIDNNFVYGNNIGRTYFSLDEKNKLIENTELYGKRKINKISHTTKRHKSLAIREYLGKFLIYQNFKRSKLAVWIAANVRVGNESLWPGIDLGVKKILTDKDKYRINLVSSILGQIQKEADGINAKTLLIPIPYIAEVYDSLWFSSFGTNPEDYDRSLPTKRLENISVKNNIYFLAMQENFIEEYKTKKLMMHFPNDGHPNKFGHKFLATKIFKFMVSNNFINE